MDTDEELHSSESSQEVDALNQLLTAFTVEDEEEEDFEIGGVGNPTKEDLQKLLSRRKERLRARSRTIGLIHARYHDAVIQMRQIRVGQSRLDKVMQKLTTQKEELLSTLTQECEDTVLDMSDCMFC